MEDSFILEVSFGPNSSYFVGPGPQRAMEAAEAELHGINPSLTFKIHRISELKFACQCEQSIHNIRTDFVKGQ